MLEQTDLKKLEDLKANLNKDESVVPVSNIEDDKLEKAGECFTEATGDINKDFDELKKTIHEEYDILEKRLYMGLRSVICSEIKNTLRNEFKNESCDFLEVAIENVVERIDSKIDTQGEYLKGIVEVLEKVLVK